MQKPTAKPKPGGAKRPGPAPSPAPFVGGEPSEIEARILDLTNAERAKAGLAPLAWNNRLGAAAQAHSANMAATGIYAHEIDGQGPGDRINNTGYKSATFGENIYLEAPAIEALFFADSAVASWMDSPGHRANILNPEYTEMGIGVAFPPYIDDGRGMYDPRWRAFYATQDFAKPLR